MEVGQIIALLGGTIVAFAVKASNVLLEKLSKVLGVEPPAPIPDAPVSGRREPDAGLPPTSHLDCQEDG